MGLITYQQLALVDATGSGLEVETFDSRLEMVKAIMDNGALGGGGGYGDKKHQAALDEIAKWIPQVRRKIKAHWASDGKGQED